MYEVSDRRRSRPPNRWGCKPTEDVCVEHDEPLACPHICEEGLAHRCAFLAEHAPEHPKLLDSALAKKKGKK